MNLLFQDVHFFAQNPKETEKIRHTLQNFGNFSKKSQGRGEKVKSGNLRSSTCSQFFGLILCVRPNCGFIPHHLGKLSSLTGRKMGISMFIRVLRVVGWSWVHHLPFRSYQNPDSATRLFTQTFHTVKPYPKNHASLHLGYVIILEINSQFKHINPSLF